MASKKNSTTRNIKTVKKVHKAVKKSKFLQILLVILVVVVIATAVTYFLYPSQTADFLARFGIVIDNNTVDKPSVAASGDLRVHFLDVGQGDCIVIEFPDGKNMVIDGGDRDSKIFKDMINPYLESLKITDFDYLLLSHTDADHAGSLDDIIKNYNVHNIYMPKVSYVQHPTATLKEFLDTVESEIISIGANKYISVNGLSIDGGSYIVDFYLPFMETYDKLKQDKAISSKERNMISPIVILTYADRKVMFTGDANLETEEQFVELFSIHGYKTVDFDVDVLKVAHHGSYEASTDEFLEIVKPEYSVISVGKSNSYGHPTKEALDRLLAVNSKIYRTDLNGTVMLTIKDNGALEFKPSKAA